MGLPQDNPKGYRDGSPITHAAKLKGNLLLVHGTADDNVHYAGTEALINELIAANKQFAMMAYPNRSHSIQEGRNTRRHLFGLLTAYLQQNLPPGPRVRFPGLGDRQDRKLVQPVPDAAQSHGRARRTLPRCDRAV
jgi:dipeptidyl-peptidase-4